MNNTGLLISPHKCSKCGEPRAFIRPGPTFTATWERCEACGYYGPMKKHEVSEG